MQHQTLYGRLTILKTMIHVISRPSSICTSTSLSSFSCSSRALLFAPPSSSYSTSSLILCSFQPSSELAPHNYRVPTGVCKPSPAPLTSLVPLLDSSYMTNHFYVPFPSLLPPLPLPLPLPSLPLPLSSSALGYCFRIRRARRPRRAQGAFRGFRGIRKRGRRKRRPPAAAVFEVRETATRAHQCVPGARGRRSYRWFR